MPVFPVKSSGNFTICRLISAAEGPHKIHFFIAYPILLWYHIFYRGKRNICPKIYKGVKHEKKILLCIAFLIAVAFASTSCSPNPGTGPSPNPTATSGAAVNIMVIAQMSDNSGVLGIEQFAVYAADGQGATLTAASVTLT